VETYSPRKLTVHGVETLDGWRLKRYAISLDPAGFEWSDFAPGLELAWAALPSPAVTDDRAGVGFVIAHRGRAPTTWCSPGGIARTNCPCGCS